MKSTSPTTVALAAWACGLALMALIAGCAASTVGTPLSTATRAIDAGDYEGAAQACRDVILSDATADVKREARVLLARLYMTRLDRSEEGLALYREVLDTDRSGPSAAEALWVLGSIAFRAGDYEAARKHFLRLVFDFAGTRFDADARVWLGAAHERLGNATAAADVYGRFIEEYASDPRADEIRGRWQALTAGADVGPAEPTALGTVVRSPQRTPAQETQQPQPRPSSVDEARRLDDAPERKPIGPETRPNARAEFASWTTSPTFGYNPRTLMMEGGSLFGGADLEQDMAATGANLDDAVLALGMLYYSEGNYDKAGACLEKAEEMGVREIRMYTALTACYLRAPNVSRAKATFSQAVKQDSGSISWLRSFAKEQLDQGQADLAREAVRVLKDFGRIDDPDLERLVPPADN